MDRYFVYSSKYQVYNALSNNAILCNALTNPQFRANALGFLSDDFIFITNDKLNNSIRSYGCTETNYPIALEVCGLEKTGAKVLLLVEEEGRLQLSEAFTDISEYPKTVDCRGAFIFGQIPFSCVNRVIFESLEDQDCFLTGSPDLWFPEEQFSTWTSEEYSSYNVKSLDVDSFISLSQAAESFVVGDRCGYLKNQIEKQLRVKAAAYCFIKGTENWRFGSKVLEGNVDGSLVAFMDSQTANREFYRYAAQQLNGISRVFAQVSSDTLKCVDPAFVQDTEVPLSPHDLLRVIATSILDSNNIDDDVIPDAFDRVFAKLKDTWSENPLIDGKIPDVVDAIQAYYHAESFAVPLDDVLSIAIDYPVLKALLIFSINPKDFDILERACIKLNQEERRYAYLMFGLFNGMPYIDGNQKNNRELEKHLESIVSAKYHDDEGLLVVISGEAGSDIPYAKHFGIVPNYILKLSREEVEAFLRNEIGDTCIKNLFEDLFAERTDVVEAVSSYSNPIEILIRSSLDRNKQKAYPIKKPDDIERTLKTVCDTVRARFRDRKTEFSSALCREKLYSDPGLFDEVYSHFCK